MTITTSGYRTPTGEFDWEGYREGAQAFAAWAMEKITRLEEENSGLRIDLRRAQMPCGCEEAEDALRGRHVRACNWCGSRYRADPVEPTRYCSDDCATDSHNLEEAR